MNHSSISDCVEKLFLIKVWFKPIFVAQVNSTKSIKRQKLKMRRKDLVDGIKAYDVPTLVSGLVLTCTVAQT